MSNASLQLKRTVAILAQMVLLVLLSGVALAQEDPCDNPRAAALSLLANLQRDHWDPAAAAVCLDVPDEKAERAPQLAVQLKTVLDARGLYVPVDSLSLAPDHVDPEGRSLVQPLSDLPVLTLERVDGRWLFSQATVNAIPNLYADTFSPLVLALQDRLPPVFFSRVLGLALWQALYFGLLVLTALLASLIAQALASDQMVRAARRLGVVVPKGVLARTRLPISLAAMGLVLLWGVPDLQLPVRGSQTLLFVARLVLALAAVIAALRIVDVVSSIVRARAAGTDSKLDDQVVPLLDRLAKVVVIALGVVFVMQNLGIDVGGLVAGLGIGGLAIALAAKDTLENFLGSLVIFSDRPFQIGDWVVIDGDVEGTVEEVGFRTTRVRTFYNSLVTVPNGRVANSRVDNMGHRNWRRVKLKLGLTYDSPRTSIKAYIDDVRTYLEGDARVASDNTTCEVTLNQFGPSSLDVLVYYFLEVPDWSAELATRQEHFLEFMRLAEVNDVRFAFPSSSLYLEEVAPKVIDGLRAAQSGPA